MTGSLAFQVITLAVVAWLVPWGLAKLLPEGVAWLVVIGLCSSALLSVFAAVGFIWLYGQAGGVIWREAPVHFLILSMRSALIWAPVMVLSLANLPRRWKEAVW